MQSKEIQEQQSEIEVVNKARQDASKILWGSGTFFSIFGIGIVIWYFLVERHLSKLRTEIATLKKQRDPIVARAEAHAALVQHLRKFIPRWPWGSNKKYPCQRTSRNFWSKMRLMNISVAFRGAS